MDDLATEMFGPVESEPLEAAPVEATPAVPEAETPPVEAQPIAEPESAPEQPRDEGGRFVPVAALVDERVKRQDFERRAVEAERQLAERSQQPTVMPDPLDDPEGYNAHLNGQFQQALTQQKFQMSDVMARQAHGVDTVETASAWAMERAKADPTFAAQYMREAHPIDWIVQQHKRDADLSDYSKDPVAFARRILESHGQQIAPVAAAQAVPVAMAPVVAAPPRSIASQPAASAVPQVAASGPIAAIESLFIKE